MSFYNKHIFICVNQKAPGKKCCAEAGSEEWLGYLKTKLTELDMYGPGKIRLSKSGCLGRCQAGPCLVIYPEQVWYHYETLADLERIIQEHFVHERVVTDLLID